MIDKTKLSKIGIGGWGIGGLVQRDHNNNDDKQVKALEYMLQKGLNFIEVNFWNSEGHSVELIKSAIQNTKTKRDNLFLALVIYNYNNPTLEDVEKEINKFFDTFETDYIDTLEFPLSAISKYGFENVVKLIKKYLSSHQTRFVSLTNANIEYLQRYRELFADSFFSHEVHYSFDVRDNEYFGILDYAAKNGIRNVIYQPLRRNRTAQRNWPLLVEISKKYGKTQNQIVLNWLVSKGYLPLVKSESIEHIGENLAALDFTLASDDIDKLNNFKVTHHKEEEIDWFINGTGIAVHTLPNIFDENYTKQNG